MRAGLNCTLSGMLSQQRVRCSTLCRSRKCIEDKQYPCNETRYTILSGLKNAGITDTLNQEDENALWHILYSISDKNELKSALTKFANKHSLAMEFVEVFSKVKPFNKEYGSYSEKAIKKLLPLMRVGKYWSKDTIHEETVRRIDKLLTGEFDETIKNKIRVIVCTKT